MRSATLLTICTLSALLLVARGSEKPSAAPPPVVAVGVAAASDLIRSGGHRYLDVSITFALESSLRPSSN
ncbi:Rhodanese-like domain-containing protein 19 mitochondrial [Zea mays]|uniref:Rhodanese-like domain-containing protein 19 mitochondrial n=1 Tax=Zea mays TaxID=4577 RepID=A0A1D6J4M4_MAIZE|nr:Rhodanese-like domain-containing protein 19 mitochondrial [Zea mays]